MITFDVPPELASSEQQRYARAVLGNYGVSPGEPLLDIDIGTLRMAVEQARRAT